MKLNDLKIGTQLRLGLGAILVSVAGLAVLAWVQTDQLFLLTKGIYEHPLKVRRAIGGLHVDVLQMRILMRGLPTAENEQEIQSALQQIDLFDADAKRQLDILYDSYLGGRKDIDDVANALVQYKTIRTETMRLLRAGKAAEAIEHLRANGVSGAHLAKTLDYIKVLDNFARNRGDQFYRDAEAEKISLNRQLGVIVAVILLLSLIVAWLLLKGIRTPLAELTAVAEQFGQGKMGARSRYTSANEFGTLSASFNSMAEVIETEMKISENEAELAGVMLREEEVHAFCRELLKALLERTGSQVGAVYFPNEAKTAFEHFQSIGLGAGGRAAFSATELEGELGAALATRRIQRITDIPADTRFAFAAVSGDFTPREILTIPILSERDVVAVVSLASVRAYDAPSVRLVNDVWSVLTARVNGVLAFRKIKDFAERLERQNRELETQKSELTLQADELSEQNIELELQKKQLHEANRLKSTFLSNMSHELRTPLNSVIALSGVLSRRLVDTIPAEELGYLEVIERNGNNLLVLINDILDLSRIEAGREEISLSRFSVGELAAEVVAMIGPQAREKNVALLNRVAHDLPPIRSDLSMCRHILQNLVGNAVKFTAQGRVEVSAVVAHDGIEIAVTDTGIGISADQFQYIFDEFRQADESMTRSYGGAGLGLSIARKYATLLRGSIGVESTPGKGSIFTLRLPLTINAPIAGEQAAETTDYSTLAASNEPPSTPGGQSKCILLVEDSEPAVVQLTDILAGQGYRVQVARNGKEALEQTEETLPDAMILDLMMPEVDGFQVLRAIRGTERTAHIPVLILTSKYVTREELSFLKENHIHQLIQKGDINRTDLLAVIGKMVRPRRQRLTPAAPTPARTRTSGKPVILVVEDNPDNMRTVRAMLQDTCTVIEASGGQSGVEQARMHAPDLILMDISLPDMDGFKALDAIRNEDALRHIPVIAVTASAMKGNREEILAHGFDGYISKPIDEKQLEETIKEKLFGHE